jgi:NAD(P)-dependent dehydrogenase (short-subunit alcohol dehydrogenase family)
LTQELLVELTNVQGVVINMGSIHQQLTKSNFVSYATSKSALVGLTKSMAVDLKGKIRVNSISPAAVKTDMLLAGFDGNDSALKELETLHPVGRIGNTKDIARLVMFLCNENDGFIHGANFTIDGGISSVLSDL